MQDFNRGRGAFMKDAEVSKLKGGRLIWTFPQTILDKTGKIEAPGHNDVDNKERHKCCVQSIIFCSPSPAMMLFPLSRYSIYMHKSLQLWGFIFQNEEFITQVFCMILQVVI